MEVVCLILRPTRDNKFIISGPIYINLYYFHGFLLLTIYSIQLHF